MRKVENNTEDKLKLWMNPGESAKAPEGFSSKVMSHIYMQARPVEKPKTSNVPLVYASLLVLLAIVTLLFVPESNLIFKKISIPWEFKLSMPEVEVSEFSLPQIIIYLIFGGVAIALFDSALLAVFKRRG